MNILLNWVVLTLTIFGLAYFVPGIAVDSVITGVIVGSCLAFINLVIKPVIKLVTLPINLLTLGLFGLVINALLFWGLSVVIPGFTVSTFQAILIGSAIVALISWLFGLRD